MTAWEKLIAGSTLPSGSAWDHLNAQSGGGSVIYVDGMSANLVEMVLSGAVDIEVFSASTVEATMSAQISSQTLSANISTVDMSAALVDIEFSGSMISMNLTASIIEAPL